MSVTDWTERYSNSVMNTFGTPATVLVRGEGTHVWDADGKEYVDLLGGIAVNSLGHNHPDLVAAVTEAAQFLHVSNFFTTPAQVALAEKLLRISGAPAGSRVFLANTGTEAVEAALKMSRRTGKSRLIAFAGGFHGRSTGALAVTSKVAYREPFDPLLPGVEFLPFGDEAALRSAMSDEVAAIIVEPIQGEGGVHTVPEGFLPLARELATEHGALLILDEVQTGMGRTGEWLAYHHHHIGGGITPDIVTLAKGLGGGVPIGAVIAYGEANSTLLGPGQHGTTFGGNPLATAAASTVIDVIERDDLLSRVQIYGKQLAAEAARANPDLIVDVRGEGLLIALQLSGDHAQAVTQQAYAAGFIVNPVAPDAIRLAPAYTLTDDDITAFATFLNGVTP